MAKAALFAALTAVLAQIVLPLGPVPFNLAVLGAFVAGLLLPPAGAVLSMGTYFAMALVGLPVLAGLSGGPGVLLGQTGGYVLGYGCIAYCTAMARRRGRRQACLGMVLGLFLCYISGTVWFTAVTGTRLLQSMALCVWPFVLPDICKGVVAWFLADILEKRGLHR